MQQRSGYPNITIQLFASYNDYINNKYSDLTPALLSLTIRDGLISKINEGMLQIFDIGEMHKKLTGYEFFRIVLATANTSLVQTRIYSMKDFSISIDQKNDNIITFQLCAYHQLYNQKFCRVLPTNAGVALTNMINVLYEEAPLLKPKIQYSNIRIPKTNWVTGINHFKKFISAHGVAIDINCSPIVYESFNGITITDHETMKLQEPKVYMLVDPEIVGQFGDMGSTKIGFDFEWKVKQRKDKNIKYDDMVYYTHNFMKNDLKFTNVGKGTNIELAQRSGAYDQKMDHKGLEEKCHDDTIKKYEGYSTMKVYGDFTVVPSNKINILDIGLQTPQTFYVDEVVHEISREQSITNLYMFN